jgi:hypothetical protein
MAASRRRPAAQQQSSKAVVTHEELRPHQLAHEDATGGGHRERGLVRIKCAACVTASPHTYRDCNTQRLARSADLQHLDLEQQIRLRRDFEARVLHQRTPSATQHTVSVGERASGTARARGRKRGRGAAGKSHPRGPVRVVPRDGDLCALPELHRAHAVVPALDHTPRPALDQPGQDTAQRSWRSGWAGSSIDNEYGPKQMRERGPGPPHTVGERLRRSRRE